MNRLRLRAEGGFTLIELLVVWLRRRRVTLLPIMTMRQRLPLSLETMALLREPT
jgi:hypothetical protein